MARPGSQFQMPIGSVSPAVEQSVVSHQIFVVRITSVKERRAVNSPFLLAALVRLRVRRVINERKRIGEVVLGRGNPVPPGI